MIRSLLILSILIICYSSCSTYNQGIKLYEKAEALYQEENYNGAIDNYKMSYAKLDNQYKGEIIFKLGMCYFKTNDCESAILWFEKAIKCKYINPDVALYYAHALSMCGYYEKALKWYQEYKKLMPNDTSVDDFIKDCEEKIK